MMSYLLPATLLFLTLAAGDATSQSSPADSALVRHRAGIPTSAQHAAAARDSADSLAARRRYQEAAAQYAIALSVWPESLSIANRALGSFWRAARYDDAYLWGQKALTAEPRSLAVLFNLGVTCGFLVELNCVESTFRRALELDSTFVEGYGELAFLAQARGQPHEAVRYMEMAYAIAPSNDFAASGLAQMLIPTGATARARSVMDARLAANRKARAYGGRSMLTLYGWALLREGDTAAASNAFDEVLGWLAERERGGETSYQLHRERAAIHALRGRDADAVPEMKTAYERGWRLYGAWSLVDPMLAGVAAHPEVAAIVDRMRDDVRVMRARVGLSSVELRNLQRIREIHEPGRGLVRRFRESGLLVDSAEWWVAGPRDVLPFAGSWRGLDGIVEFEKHLGATMRYDKVEIREYIVSGNDVVAVFLGEGVARATGKPFRSEIVRVYSFSGDKVVRVRNYYDTYAYVRAVRGDP